MDECQNHAPMLEVYLLWNKRQVKMRKSANSYPKVILQAYVEDRDVILL